MDEEQLQTTLKEEEQETAETTNKFRWTSVSLANVGSVNGVLVTIGSRRGAPDADAKAGSHVVVVNSDRTSGARTRNQRARPFVLRVRAAVASILSPAGSTLGALQA